MAGSVSNGVEDAKVAGSFIKRAGATAILSIAVIVLAISLVFSIITDRVGPDRYTAADHAKFLLDYEADLKSQQEEQRLLKQQVSQTSQDIAVIREKATSMEKSLEELRSILLRERGWR